MKLLFSTLFLMTLTTFVHAVNTPCSGSKGGINHCEGSKFVCNDGSYSESTKDCSTYFTPTCISPQVLQNGICVTPAPAPTVSFDATPNSVASGSASTLTWSSSDATACIASGNWSGVLGSSGSQSTGVLTSTKSYTLSCSGDGGSATQTITITVTEPQPICSSPQIVQNGICVTPQTTCSSPQVLQNGICITPELSCTAPQILKEGICVAPEPICELPKILKDGICVDSSQKDEDLLQLNYDDFTLWLDCKKHGATKFEYVTKPDTNAAKRSNTFFLDPDVPASCQQQSIKPYGKGYDRGHLVPANHFDYSNEAVKSTNVMTNVLPQAATMNRGAWLLTEEIIECYRDVANLTVIGGVIWGNNTADDFFVKTHGVETPDAFWKTIIKNSDSSQQVISWIVPNSKSANRKQLDAYLKTINEIEALTGETIPVANELKDQKPQQSWSLPKGCNKQ